MSSEQPQTRRERRTIVVIDDDPHTSGMLTSWFAGRSYDVLSASDGPTGLELAFRQFPDLLDPQRVDLRVGGADAAPLHPGLGQRVAGAGAQADDP